MLLQILFTILKEYKDVNKVMIYGSRAKGTFNQRSDVDLVICDSEINQHILVNVLLSINNSDFPYTVDLQFFENIKNPRLIEHIQRVGKVLYERSNIEKDGKILH